MKRENSKPLTKAILEWHRPRVLPNDGSSILGWYPAFSVFSERGTFVHLFFKEGKWFDANDEEVSSPEKWAYIDPPLPPRLKFKIGDVVGRLTLLDYIEGTWKPFRVTGRWDCLCKCGKRVEIDSNALVQGHTKSCGCFQHDKHENRKDLYPTGFPTRGPGKKDRNSPGLV